MLSRSPNTTAKIVKLFTTYPITGTMIVIDMIQILHILREEYNKVGVLSNCLTRDFEIILCDIKRINAIMPSPCIHILNLVLRS